MVREIPDTIVLEKQSLKNRHINTYINNILIKKLSKTTAQLELDCPFDIVINGPNGREISKDKKGDHSYIYSEFDLNGDRHDEDLVTIYNCEMGIYAIQVIPEENVTSNDKFSLKACLGNMSIILAKDQNFNIIPGMTYLIEVANGKIIQPLLVNKTASLSSAPPGALIDFNISVTNTGSVPLSDIKLIDHIPIGLRYLYDNKGGSISGRNITWNNLGYLDQGKSIFIQLAARVDSSASGNLTNLVEALGIRVTEKQEAVSNSVSSTVSVLEPGISVDKTLGFQEPLQYEQYCESQKIKERRN
jgi:uncharacterized repeat protein (TIGR01451 family)